MFYGEQENAARGLESGTSCETVVGVLTKVLWNIT